MKVKVSSKRPSVAIVAVAVTLLLGSLTRDGDGDRPRLDISPGALAAGIVWFFLGPLYVILLHTTALHLRDGLWREAAELLPFSLGLTLVLFPWAIVRVWLIPRGRPLLAWLLSRLSFWVWRRDVAGGAVVAAAWAALRCRKTGARDDDEPSAFVRGRLAKLSGNAPRWTVGSAAVVASALLAARGDDRDQARALFASAGDLDRLAGPAQALAIAWEWLCADAVEREAWRELDTLAQTSPVASPSVRFLGAVAARLTGSEPMPRDLELWARWLLAPNRRQTLTLLERALATPPVPRRDRRRPAPEPEPADPSSGGSPLTAALAAHALLLARPNPARSVTAGELSALARRWDRVFDDPSLERQLLERASALAPKRPPLAAELRTQFRQQIREDLLELAQAAGVPIHELGGDSELLGQAARALRVQLLDALEMATAALDDRVEAHRELPPLDEWRAFLSIREQYSQAVALGGSELRRMAFNDVHGPMCSLAVWLWNIRGERAIANAMFHWLLAEAVVVDHAEAIRLQEKNVACGL